MARRLFLCIGTEFVNRLVVWQWMTTIALEIHGITSLGLPMGIFALKMTSAVHWILKEMPLDALR